MFRFFAKYYVLSNHNNFGRGKGGRAGISKNVTKGGSQLTWEGGRAGISKNMTKGGVTTDLGGGEGRNKQKRDGGGVTTDLLDV